jgi:hypothetical protein
MSAAPVQWTLPDQLIVHPDCVEAVEGAVGDQRGEAGEVVVADDFVFYSCETG